MSTSTLARILGAVLGTACLFAPPAQAVDPGLDWKTISSPHFNLHFHPGEERLAPRILAIAERVHERLSARFGWQPATRTEVVLTDGIDLANGYSMPLPYNKMVLYVTPPDDADGFDEFEAWQELLLTHEYTHILHMDKASGAPHALRRVFGRNLLTFPAIFQPTWVAEGLATYQETDSERGIGRGQNANFAMMMRAELMRGIKPFDQVSMSGLSVWPQGHTPYLYGVHFIQFLTERYGEGAVRRVVDEYGNNLVPFLFHRNFRQVLGKDTPQLWAEFQTYLKARYTPQLEAIRARGVVAGERITDHGYRTCCARVGADGALYYVRDDSLRHPMLMRRTAAGSEPIAPVTMAPRIDLHPEAGILVAQPDFVGNYDVFYDLYRIDPKSGDTRRLSEGGRYRFGAWDPSGRRIAAVAATVGESRLELLDADGKRLDLLWQGSAGEILSKPDFAPDGSAIVAAVWRDGYWNLESFDLAARRWRKLTDDAAVEADPQFTPDGRHLLFTSNHGGVYNLRRLALAGGGVETLTNVETGAFAPVADAEGAIYYVGYGADGYDIHRLPPDAAALPLPPAPKPRPRTAPPESSIAAPVRDYSPWSTLAPTSWFPLLTVTEELFEAGAAIAGEDAVGGHQYIAALSVEASRGLVSADVAYLYHNRLAVQAARQHVYDHDDDGDLARIRAVDAYAVQLTLPHLSFEQILLLQLGVGSVTEREVEREAGVAPLAATRDAVAGLALTFDSTKTYARAIGRNEGRAITALAESSDVLASDYSGEVYLLDWREFLPAGRHALALRVAEGWGTDRPRPFELGGTVTDDGFPGTAFNERRYGLRGYPTGLAELTGRRFQLGSAEWHFPIIELERAFRRPPLGLHRLSGAAFFDVGAAWDDGSRPDAYRRGTGVELFADTHLFYLIDVRIRAGIAHGLDAGGETQGYLTLGTAF